MQRVRIGLTGLAFVFVLVLLAAIFTRTTEEEPITANSLENRVASSTEPASAAANQVQPKEPLAELGVAPGNLDGNSAASERQAAEDASTDGRQ